MYCKTRVGIIFGGRSAEHEVSLQSAKNVFRALDKDRYEPVLIGINKEGRWHAIRDQKKAYDVIPDLIRDPESWIPAFAGMTKEGSLSVFDSLDVVFPVLHGPFGEDGTVQGLLKLLDVPFVGAGVLGSAVGMDKDVAKRLFRDAGIPTAKFLVYGRKELADFESIVGELGLPFFIKPANLGSSVGIHKVKSLDGFDDALEDAFRYDTKILVEEYIRGREIECSVLGNDDPVASLPGEVIPQHEFYSYEAKYIDENGAKIEIPAKLSPEVAENIRQMALRAFKALCLQGMARVDFFVKNNTEIFVNEVNTIPGFTSISMYPKLWEASGIPYTKLIDTLIGLAIERHKKEKKLKTSVISTSEERNENNVLISSERR